MSKTQNKISQSYTASMSKSVSYRFHPIMSASLPIRNTNIFIYCQCYIMHGYCILVGRLLNLIYEKKKKQQKIVLHRLPMHG